MCQKCGDAMFECVAHVLRLAAISYHRNADVVCSCHTHARNASGFERLTGVNPLMGLQM